MSDTSSALGRLNADLHDLYQDIDYFATPLEDVHDALAAFERVEKIPQDMKGKVHEINGVLSALKGACHSAEWLPEVGTGAKSAAEFLDGANIVLGEVETFLEDIQTAANEATEGLTLIKKPVDTSWTAIAKVEGFIEGAENVTGTLLKKYKGQDIPTSVNACSDGFDKPLHQIVGPLNDAKDEANKQLNSIGKGLNSVVSALNQVANVADFVDHFYAALKPFRDAITSISNALRKAGKYSAKQINSLLHEFRHLKPKTYDKVRAFLDSIQRAVDDIIAKFKHKLFAPLHQAINGAKNAIIRALGDLPDFSPAQKAMQAVEHQLGLIETAIDALSQKCADLFEGKTQPS